jgi:tripartite-type tricarboxylate transporter receptor subunit TctC
LFLVTRPTLAPDTLAEFVAYAKANPGKLSYGSAGNGTTPHVGGELFKQAAGITAAHIPIGAAPAIQSVMAGQVDYALVPGTAFPSKGRQALLLAVASRRRPSYAADVSTIEEAGFGKVYVDTPFAVYAPAAMPAAHVMRMNRELNRLLAQPVIKARFAEVGAEPMTLSPAELTAMVGEEAALFGPIVRTRASGD